MLPSLLYHNCTCHGCQWPPSCLIQWSIFSSHLISPVSSIWHSWSLFEEFFSHLATRIWHSPCFPPAFVTFPSRLICCPCLHSSQPLEVHQDSVLGSLSSLTLGNPIWSYGFNCHLYAVNSHIYIWFNYIWFSILHCSMNSRFLCPAYYLVSPTGTSNRHLHLNMSKNDLLTYQHNHLSTNQLIPQLAHFNKWNTIHLVG